MKMLIIIIIITFMMFDITNSVEFQSFLQLPRIGSTGNEEPMKGRMLHVHSYGAVGDGISDDTEAFISAWKVACSLSSRSSILIPEGYTYLVRPINFAGCQAQITLRIYGAIVAPKDPRYWRGLNHRKWLYFHGVEHLTLEGGGTINGMGEEWWARSCKINATIPCHHAPTAMTFHKCKGLKIRDINIVKSQQTHVSFTDCLGVMVSNVTLTTPSESPNTDGIHISASTNVEIKDSVINTGDDCVSIVSNSSRIRVMNIFCGAGTHGISIGSLGKWKQWSEVDDVLVDGAYLHNTQNGVRVKTWQGGSGFATKITFQNVWMENVTNPIIVDQYYCDAPNPCENQTSTVNISKISFVGIKGTSASEEAIRFACSDTIPCQQLRLEDIQLLTYTGVATSFCWNAHGSSSGIVYPPPCFSTCDPTNVINVAEKDTSSSAFSSI
ncbi:hypothetical protein vseg_013002 [Gypsophila vaccaria]